MKLLDHEEILDNLIGKKGTLERNLYECEFKLDIAMEIIDDYLNAGDKDKRQKSAVKAKTLYKIYYGKEYKNRNER